MRNKIGVLMVVISIIALAVSGTALGLNLLERSNDSQIAMTAPANGFECSIKIGNIRGGSLAAGHQGDSDVISWHWERNGEITDANHADSMVLTKYVDRATPELLLACVNRKHFSTASLIERQWGDDGIQRVLLVSLWDVIIDSVNDDQLEEIVTLKYGKYKLQYLPTG